MHRPSAWFALLTYRVAVRRWFWPVRRALAYAGFRIRKARFAARSFGTERWSTVTFGRRFLREVALYTTFAGVLVGLGVASDLVVVPRLGVSWGVPLHVIEPSVVVDISNAIAQVLGVLLGLYFAAIGVVLSSAYSRVESDLRALSIRETVGNPYLRFLTLGAIYSLLLAVVVGAGYPGSRTGLVGLFLLTSYAIVAFLALGMRVYRLFDPQILSVRLALDIVDSLKLVVLKSPYALDASFQTHQRKRVEATLSTWRDLLAFVAAPPAPNLAASRDLIRDLLGIWVVYNDQKPNIPAESDWYPQRAYHENLLTADHMNFGVNLATATMRSPTLERDHLWFDRAIATLIADQLAVHLSRADADGIVVVLQILQAQIFEVAKKLSTDESSLMEEIVSNAVIAALPRLVEGTTASATPERIAATVAIADLVALAPIQVLLGPIHRIEKLLPTALGQNDWHGLMMRRQFHSDVLPRPVLVILEDIRRRLEFELRVEGRFVTPPWYLQQAYARALVEHVSSAFDRAVTRIEAAYLPRITHLEPMSGGRAALHVALRGREACNKITAHAETVAAWCRAMRSVPVSSDNRPNDIDVAAFEERSANLDTSLLREIARLGVAVYEEELPSNRLLPDYFGEAYIRLIDGLFWRMAEGKDAHFPELFGAVARMSILAFNRIRKDVPASWGAAAIARYRAPFANMLELSGHAYLFTQLGRPNFWRIAKIVWERDLLPAIPPQMLRAVISEAEAPVMDPWFPTHFAWKKEVTRQIQEVLAGGGELTPFIGTLGRTFTWRSPLRELHGVDVFLVVYLRHQAGFEDFELPSSAESLQRSINRVTEHGDETAKYPFY